MYKANNITETYIHPTAIVSKDAKIAENVYIGEYCIIGNCVIRKILQSNLTLKSMMMFLLVKKFVFMNFVILVE